MKTFRSKQIAVDAIRNTFKETIYVGDELLEADPGNWIVTYNGIKYKVANLPHDKFLELYEEVDADQEIKEPEPAPVHEPMPAVKVFRHRKKFTKIPITEEKRWNEIVEHVLSEHQKKDASGKTYYLDMKFCDIAKIASKRFGRRIPDSSLNKFIRRNPKIKRGYKQGYYRYNPPESHQIAFAPKEQGEPPTQKGPFAEIIKKKYNKREITCPDCGETRTLTVNAYNKNYKTGKKRCMSCAIKLWHKERKNNG